MKTEIVSNKKNFNEILEGLKFQDLKSSGREGFEPSVTFQLQ